jgi:outer membrane protein OmpA-like peptidoglycan-associated protein
MPKLALNLVFDPRKKPVPEPEPVVVIPVDTIKPEPIPVVKPDIIKQLMAENPVLCDISDYRPYDPTKPMRRDSAALLVHFELDKYDLKRDFRQNAETLDRVISLTRQIVADSTAEVRLIQIIGFASIEGRIKHNEMLGEQRAIALKRYIQNAVEVPDSMFELNNGGEAWAEFRDQIAELIEKHDDQSETMVAELKRAIYIIDNEPAADHREQRLRVLNGGRTWNYIKEHVLADQRNSGYMRIYLERKKP